MELVLLVAVVLSAATNIFFIKQAKAIINVTVPVPQVYLTVEAPEALETQVVHHTLEAVSYDFDKLEEILQQLVDLQRTQQLPYVIPNPIPIPQPPSPYWQSPTISRDTTNETEIDGVRGKQFPAR